MEFFSSRGALLDVIFELGTFGIDDLFTKYVRSGKGEPISKKDVESYLEELAQIRILKVSKGTFIVQPALKH